MGRLSGILHTWRYMPDLSDLCVSLHRRGHPPKPTDCPPVHLAPRLGLDSSLAPAEWRIHITHTRQHVSTRALFLHHELLHVHSSGKPLNYAKLLS